MYYNKYIKYKAKYLNLLDLSGGVGEEITYNFFTDPPTEFLTKINFFNETFNKESFKNLCKKDINKLDSSDKKEIGRIYRGFSKYFHRDKFTQDNGYVPKITGTRDIRYIILNALFVYVEFSSLTCDKIKNVFKLQNYFFTNQDLFYTKDTIKIIRNRKYTEFKNFLIDHGLNIGMIPQWEQTNELEEEGYQNYNDAETAREKKRREDETARNQTRKQNEDSKKEEDEEHRRKIRENAKRQEELDKLAAENMEKAREAREAEEKKAREAREAEEKKAREAAREAEEREAEEREAREAREAREREAREREAREAREREAREARDKADRQEQADKQAAARLAEAREREAREQNRNVMLRNLQNDVNFIKLKTEVSNEVSKVVIQYEGEDVEKKLEAEDKKRLEITQKSYDYANKSSLAFDTVCREVDIFVQKVSVVIDKIGEVKEHAAKYINAPEEVRNRRDNVAHYTNAINTLKNAVSMSERLITKTTILSSVLDAQTYIFKSSIIIGILISKHNDQVKNNNVLLSAYNALINISDDAVVDALTTASSAKQLTEKFDIMNPVSSFNLRPYNTIVMNLFSNYIPTVLKTDKTVKHSIENANDCTKNADVFIYILSQLKTNAKEVKDNALSAIDKVSLVIKHVMKSGYFDILLEAENNKAKINISFFNIDNAITTYNTAVSNFEDANRKFNAAIGEKDNAKTAVDNAFNEIKKLKYYMNKGNDYMDTNNTNKITMLARIGAKTDTEKTTLKHDTKQFRDTLTSNAEILNRKYVEVNELYSKLP
jgi:hypothetical protein